MIASADLHALLCDLQPAKESPATIRERAGYARDWIEANDVQTILPADPEYPERLNHLRYPPRALFCRGRIELLPRTCVAIVGSRAATHYGRDCAHQLALDITLAGVTVVSGFARGVDENAHAGALDSGSSAGTIGVLGCGLDRVYPWQLTPLKERVIQNGLLITEFIPGDPANPWHFPQRNRIIAALAQAVVVVEASDRSGALSTARQALDLGREVLAVPGPIGRTTSIGSNELLRDGAGVVTCAADILMTLGIHAPPEVREETEPPRDWSQLHRMIWTALDAEPRHLDELAADASVESANVLSALLDLELQGHATQFPGLRFARTRQRTRT